MLQKSHFNIFDLQGFRRTQETLDRLLIRKDYRIGESTLNDNMVNSNQTTAKRKEAMLAKACEDLKIDSVIYEFKAINPANDKQAIEAMNEQKNLLDLMLAVKINREIARLLEKDALDIFAYEQKMKEYGERIADIRAQERTEALLRTNGGNLEQKRQMEAQLSAMLNEMHAQTMRQLEDIFTQVEKLAQEYTELQETRDKNHERHMKNIDNMVDEFKIDGQKIFTAEDKDNIKNQLATINVVKNNIEKVDRKITKQQDIIKDTTKDLLANRDAQASLRRDLAEAKANENPDNQNLIDDYLSSLEEDAASEVEAFICREHLLDLQKEKNALAESQSEPDSKEKSEIMSKISKISIEELKLQEKIAALRERQESIAEKSQEKFNKMMQGSGNIIIVARRVAELKKLEAEEKKLEERIKRAENKIEDLTEKRQSLHEKLNDMMHIFDGTFDKTKNWVKQLFTTNKSATTQATPADEHKIAAATAEIDALKRSIEDESETDRTEDNALAEQQSALKNLLLRTSTHANAVAGAEMSCCDNLRTVSPHSQHLPRANQYQQETAAQLSKINAAVGAALGANVGATFKAHL